MKKRRFFFTLLLTLWFFQLFCFAAMGNQAEIRDVLITQSTEHIYLYAKVSDAVSRDMEKAIMAGVPTTITFLVDIYRERSMWLDKKVAGAVIKQTVKYDNVKKIFQVWLHNSPDPESFQDFESAKRALTELNGIIAAPVRQLPRYQPLYVMIKAKLDKIRLPLGMEYIFFFVSLWDFETAWYKQRFML